MCTNGTTTANACRTCTDGSTTANACSSCTDGTTANQCTSCTDGTNSIHSTCTQCSGGSTTANSQCPPPSPSAQGPDPCQTEQDTFNQQDATAHSLQNSLQGLRAQQKSLDDAYNQAVLSAAATNGTNAAFSLASLGAGAVTESLGIQTAVTAGTSAVLESFLKSVGQTVAASAIQAVAQQGLDINALTSASAGAAAKQAVLEAIRESLVQGTMQSLLGNGLQAGGANAGAYQAIRTSVAGSFGPLIDNLSNYAGLVSNQVTGNSLPDQILLDQNHIEDLRALDNKVTGDISVQELQLSNTLGDLDNARSAVNYCRGLHPEYNPGNSNSSTSGS
jgi:hypothetical protein